ncbi:MAG: AzlD domain-containing protein [Candidatus Hodarchaeales archaeon]|jgi:branched-subunit amino acid transport protein
MDITQITVFVPVFTIIGLITFFLRAVFLYILPEIMENSVIKQGLQSVSNSLLVALVVPFTFFITGVFSPWRIEVLALIVVVPIVWITKKPGLSIISALGIFLGLDLIFI